MNLAADFIAASRTGCLRANEPLLEVTAKGASTGDATAACRLVGSAQVYAVVEADKPVGASTVSGDREGNR